MLLLWAHSPPPFVEKRRLVFDQFISVTIYHKSYEIGNPIEVQAWPDKIEILSFPGPIPPMDVLILNHQRRIGAGIIGIVVSVIF